MKNLYHKFPSLKWMATGAALFAFSLNPIHGYAQSKPSSRAATETKNYKPDNSGKNARDVQGGPLTPEDQSENRNDLKLTQQIRRSIVKDSTLSMLAKNVKIITVNGQVTLRGPVSTEAEKNTIASKASEIAGTGKVSNQIEVKNK